MLNNINIHQFRTKSNTGEYRYLRFKSTAAWTFTKCYKMEDQVANYA
mgnify:CR=1 FL=1